ncbi:YraN family protein [Joostella sp. CR20]|uniref:YraN family protein n=1 Tax=Joostella sp. CR20 TaxID=2804312 RepID=UPI00313E29EA
MATHNDFGKEAEAQAVSFLRKKNYVIHEQNYRYNFAEVDIIAEVDNMLVCVEVKARTSNFFGDPQSFVSSKKIKLMVKAMDYYITQHEIEKELRFDIIAVLKQNNKISITHFEDAFYHF